ncbi:hypothetical protein J1605_019441 [Eschrichtius robustus]|uniref:Uncharacterized protein n=1 Tax=Eschrichtius robustus TaxID=9764 RepID=A0AB34HMP7_ESCRO|nr:hypothetical protein J1605_019441 [Eschrichtius robustus]
MACPLFPQGPPTAPQSPSLPPHGQTPVPTWFSHCFSKARPSPPLGPPTAPTRPAPCRHKSLPHPPQAPPLLPKVPPTASTRPAPCSHTAQWASTRLRRAVHGYAVTSGADAPVGPANAALVGLPGSVGRAGRSRAAALPAVPSPAAGVGPSAEEGCWWPAAPVPPRVGAWLQLRSLQREVSSEAVVFDSGQQRVESRAPEPAAPT